MISLRKHFNPIFLFFLLIILTFLVLNLGAPQLLADWANCGTDKCTCYCSSKGDNYHCCCDVLSNGGCYCGCTDGTKSKCTPNKGGNIYGGSAAARAGFSDLVGNYGTWHVWHYYR